MMALLPETTVAAESSPSRPDDHSLTQPHLALHISDFEMKQLIPAERWTQTAGPPWCPRSPHDKYCGKDWAPHEEKRRRNGRWAWPGWQICGPNWPSMRRLRETGSSPFTLDQRAPTSISRFILLHLRRNIR